MAFDNQAVIRSQTESLGNRILRLLLEYGAQGPKSLAETLYPDAPKWRRQEVEGRIEKRLRKLRKRGLVNRCRSVYLFYISERGREHLEWIDRSRKPPGRPS